MKTIEQAAKECLNNFLFTAFYTESEIKTAIIEAFEAGVEWQKAKNKKVVETCCMMKKEAKFDISTDVLMKAIDILTRKLDK